MHVPDYCTAAMSAASFAAGLDAAETGESIDTVAIRLPGLHPGEFARGRAAAANRSTGIYHLANRNR